MSVHRSFAQRNNNVTTIVPERFPESLTEINITGAAIYTLRINKAHYVGGSYCVDLSAPDSDGNALDFSGVFESITVSGQTIPIILFAVEIDTVAAIYPGLECPLSFKNMPFLESFSTTFPFITIGIMSDAAFMMEAPPMPYIVSPPFPPYLGRNATPNLTYKSNGEVFEVSSSGPAGWMGVPALSVILGAYNSLP
jgi:hypothetical protein